MGILSNIERRSTLKNPADWLNAALTGQASASGVRVTQKKAYGLTAWWAGVRIISQTIASLPIDVLERQDNRRTPRRDHRLHYILNVQPNEHMTPYTFKEIRAAHVLTWGNSYAEIEMDGAGRPVALWPLLPDRTGVELIDGNKIFWTVVNGKKIYLDKDRVLHIPGLGYDGLRGYNPIEMHRDALGLSVSANEYGSRFFKSGGIPSSILIHKGRPKKEERAELRESWSQAHEGLTNAQRTALIWGDLDWKQVSLPPETAQFLQTRRTQIEEIARILNINPILLQHTEGATTWGTAIGQFLIAFAKFTIIPWLEREEDAMNAQLFSGAQRGRLYVKYNVNALLRGDPKTQSEMLQIKRRNGIINGDEWRALDDEDPLPDDIGKAYIVPANMITLERAIDQDRQTASQAGDATDGAGDNDTLSNPEAPEQRAAGHRENRSQKRRLKIREQSIGLFEDAFRRLTRRETQALQRALKRAEDAGDPVASFNDWIETFYPGQAEAIKRTMRPLVESMSNLVSAEAAEEVDADDPEMDDFVDGITDGIATRETNSSIGQLRKIIDENATSEFPLPAAAIAERAAEWMDKRPQKSAEAEVVRVEAGATRHTWAKAGVSKMVWRANADACPICQEMDGRTASVTSTFLAQGDAVNAAGNEPLIVETDIVAPPLHRGCICDIVPG